MPTPPPQIPCHGIQGIKHDILGIAKRPVLTALQAPRNDEQQADRLVRMVQARGEIVRFANAGDPAGDLDSGIVLEELPEKAVDAALVLGFLAFWLEGLGLEDLWLEGFANGDFNEPGLVLDLVGVVAVVVIVHWLAPLVF